MNTLHGDVFTFMTISHWFILTMRNVQIKVVEKIKTHILCSVTFFRKWCRLWDKVKKYVGARGGQKWRQNMAHTRFMLDKQGYTHTRMHTPTPPGTHTHARRQVCNIYCFSAAKIVTRTRLNVILYARCLSFSNKLQFTKVLICVCCLYGLWRLDILLWDVKLYLCKDIDVSCFLIKRCPSSEVSSRSANQEIPDYLFNPNCHALVARTCYWTLSWGRWIKFTPS